MNNPKIKQLLMSRKYLKGIIWFFGWNVQRICKERTFWWKHVNRNWKICENRVCFCAEFLACGQELIGF